jgi:hypothetical protein
VGVFLSGSTTSDPRDPLLCEVQRVPNANQIYTKLRIASTVRSPTIAFSSIPSVLPGQ